MDKCWECGLERSSHTQLPHRFKVVPPNPDQGVLFDRDLMMRGLNVESPSSHAKDSLVYFATEFGKAFKLNARKVEFIEGDPIEVSPALRYDQTLEGASLNYGAAIKAMVGDVPRDFILAMLKYNATHPKPSPKIMRRLQMNAEDEALGIFVPKAKRLQAKHIPDERILMVIDELTVMRYTAMTWEIYAAWPHIPRKVILAKLDKMVRRKILDGCACGCSGQFRIIKGPRMRCLRCKVQKKDHALKSPHCEFFFPE